MRKIIAQNRSPENYFSKGPEKKRLFLIVDFDLEIAKLRSSMLIQEEASTVVGRKFEVKIWISLKFIQRHRDFAHA